MRQIIAVALAVAVVSAACANDRQPFNVESVTSFNEPWAMAFLPDGNLLVTEKSGQLLLVSADGQSAEAITGVPAVDYGGQGGLGDIALHPDYADNGVVYLSYAESGDDDTRGAAVARAVLDIDAKSLSDVTVIWRQFPKTTGKGHYGHRLLFDDEGYLWVSSGERQKFDPSQDMQSNMGKLLRLNEDGSAAEGNPFFDQGGVTAEIWSLGHRNPLGIDFDTQGRLWNSEMGPRHGDELNLVIKGENYGYPIVSNGRHYSGMPIPDHDTRPDLEAPKEWWNPSIAPADLMFYDGDAFADWIGDAFIPGLAGKTLVRVEIDGDDAREAQRYDMGKRIRSVEQGPDGNIWLLEDQEGGRLLKLTPR
ncbi:MAG: PQQ-dependent sugar dehydrogenase [Pseudomonadota bacterium]